MRFNSFTALFAISNIVLGVSAGPLAVKRQDASTSVSSTSASSSESSSTATSASSTAPTVGLVETILSNGETSTMTVAAPQATIATTTVESSEPSSTTTYTFSRTGLPEPVSTNFPMCRDANAKPFCLPSNESTLYVGKTYYATWNPDFFPNLNSTVIVKVQYTNDSEQEVWSSEKTNNRLGFVAVQATKEWKQGYDMYNLTFHAINFEGDDPTKKATTYDGPMFTIKNEPPRHYPPPPVNKLPNKEGLMIGLPVGLGFVLLVVVGLLFGMRKHRTIGLGNIMGRRNRGYGVGKSRRQRLGLGKKGAIRLEAQQPGAQYSTVPAHTRGESLGSLMSDDEIRPAPGGNQFRDEIRRQKTGR